MIFSTFLNFFMKEMHSACLLGLKDMHIVYVLVGKTLNLNPLFRGTLCRIPFDVLLLRYLMY